MNLLIVVTVVYTNIRFYLSGRDTILTLKVSMTWICHDHKPHTNPQYCGKATMNLDSHTTARTYLYKQPAFLFQQDFFKTRRDVKNYVCLFMYLELQYTVPNYTFCMISLSETVTIAMQTGIL